MKKYFCLQIKRIIGMLPVILSVALLLCAATSVIFAVMIKLDSSGEERQKVTIGIVGDTSDSFLGIGIKALENFDSSRFAIEFTETDEEKAKALLQKGEIAAYAVIPDDFIDSLVYGKIEKIKYYTTADSIGISAIFEKEVTQVVSDILVQSQKGVYGLANAMTDNGAGYDAVNKMNELCVDYIDLIINRTSMGNNEIIGVADGLSIQCYFLCSIATLLMFLFGITFISIYVKSDKSLNKIMYANGATAPKQILCEYSAYFLLMYLLVALTAVSFSMVDGLRSMIPEFEFMGFNEGLTFAVKLIPLVAMISAFHFMLFELTSDIVSGVMLQFVTSVSLAYISGCLYPIYFFPETVQNISVFLPVGAARSYISECMVQKPLSFSFIAVILYFVLFLLLTMYIRNCRIKGRRR